MADKKSAYFFECVQHILALEVCVALGHGRSRVPDDQLNDVRGNPGGDAPRGEGVTKGMASGIGSRPLAFHRELSFNSTPFEVEIKSPCGVWNDVRRGRGRRENANSVSPKSNRSNRLAE